MAKKTPAELAMDEMEQFEKEYSDTSYELDVEEPEATPEGDQTATDATGDEEEVVSKETADQDPPEDAAQEPTVGETEPEGDQPPEPELFKIPNDPEKWGHLAGKEVTEEQFLQSGLVNKLLTPEHQAVHFQQKYNEEVPSLRQKVEELEKRLTTPEKPAEQPEPSPQELTPARVEEMGKQLEANFLPQIEKFAEMGGIEEHMVTDSPRFLSTLEYRLQSGQKVIDTLVQGFGALAADWMERNQAAQNNEARTTLEGSMMEIATNDGFNSLSEAPAREEFGNWLAENPAFTSRDVNDLKGNVMEIAFLEYMKSTGGTPQTAPKTPSPRRREAMMATGGGSGGSGGAGEAPLGELEKFMKDYEKAQEERY